MNKDNTYNFTMDQLNLMNDYYQDPIKRQEVFIKLLYNHLYPMYFKNKITRELAILILSYLPLPKLPKDLRIKLTCENYVFNQLNELNQQKNDLVSQKLKLKSIADQNLKNKLEQRKEEER